MRLENLEEYGISVTNTIPITRNYTLHLIDEPGVGTPFDIIGIYGFITGNDTRKTNQHFVITNRYGNLSGHTSLKEFMMLLRIGAVVEKEVGDVSVLDVTLPKSFGFSGKKYWHRQILTQYPHLK